MDFAADLPSFFSDFAIDLTVNGVPARGIFDDAFGVAFGGMIDGSGPMLRLPTSVAAARGQPVVIDSRSYVITGVEPDGTGITTLRLDLA